MIITCPKCEASYEVDGIDIPQEGKKLHCSNCGNLWVVYPEVREELPNVELEPAIIATNEEVVEKIDPTEISKEFFVNQNDRIEPKETSVASIMKASLVSDDVTEEPKEAEGEGVADIFARLSSKKEDLEKDFDNLSGFEKSWIKVKKETGLARRKSRVFISLLLAILILLSLFYFRFDITRNYPFVAPAYEALGIDSVVVGQGLEFENVTRTDGVLDDKPQIVVKGFIRNKNSDISEIPTISIQLLDKAGDVIQKHSYELDTKEIGVDAMVPFSVSVDTPKEFVKYILVTFTDN